MVRINDASSLISKYSNKDNNMQMERRAGWNCRGGGRGAHFVWNEFMISKQNKLLHIEVKWWLHINIPGKCLNKAEAVGIITKAQEGNKSQA